MHYKIGFPYDILIVNIFFAFIYLNAHMRKKFTIHNNTSIHVSCLWVTKEISYVKVRNSTFFLTRQRTQYVLKPEVIASYIFAKEFKWMKKMMYKKCMGDMKNVNAQKNNLFQAFVSLLVSNTQMNEMSDKKANIKIKCNPSNFLAKFLYCIPGISYLFNIQKSRRFYPYIMVSTW